MAIGKVSAVRTIYILAIVSILFGCSTNDRITQERFIYGESFSMELVRIEAGSFIMGWNDGQRGQLPEHKVTISKPFFIGKYEVNQKQWYQVMGRTIEDQWELARQDQEGIYSIWDDYGKIWQKGDDYPIYFVSWNEAREFCRRLSIMTGDIYRLPTEAEFEYASRAGTRTPFFWGKGLPEVDGVKYANVADESNVLETPPPELTKYYYFKNYDDGYRNLAPVGQFAPNPWLLHDTCGNVSEWCQDWYQEDWYERSPEVDPVCEEPDKYRVTRGGCWNDIPMYTHEASRGGKPPELRHFVYGLRVVREVSK